MADIVSINRETPTEFIRRNGPTLTHEVAYRFGIGDVRAVLPILKQLERGGVLKSRRVTFAEGAGLEWTVAP